VSPRTRPDQVYLGPPCRHGHSGERYTATGKCTECQRSQLLARYRAFQKQRGATEPQRAAKARATARRLGREFYIGMPCRAAGHRKHFTATACCAECPPRHRLRLHELSAKERARVLKIHRDRGRRATRALQVLKELGLRI
jgi:hypothetical protein